MNPAQTRTMVAVVLAFIVGFVIVVWPARAADNADLVRTFRPR